MATQQDIIASSLVVNGPICADTLKITGEVKAKDLTNCCTIGYYQSPEFFLESVPLCLDDPVDDYLYEGENCRIQQIGWGDCIPPVYAFQLKHIQGDMQAFPDKGLIQVGKGGAYYLHAKLNTRALDDCGDTVIPQLVILKNSEYTQSESDPHYVTGEDLATSGRSGASFSQVGAMGMDYFYYDWPSEDITCSTTAHLQAGDTVCLAIRYLDTCGSVWAAVYDVELVVIKV